MLFYKTLRIQNFENKNIEKGIRQFTKKRRFALDTLPVASYGFIGDKEYFIGVENDTAVEITRIKTPFEFFFPKVIAQFSKKDFSVYRLRLGFLHLAILLFLFIFLVLPTTLSFLNNPVFTEDLLFLPLFFAYCGLIFFETWVTNYKIRKALNNSLCSGIYRNL